MEISKSSAALTWLAACFSFPATGALAADPPTLPATAATATTPVAPTPLIDASAMALLKKVQTAMLAPRSYRAECRTTQTMDAAPGKVTRQGYEMATLTAEKPNLMRYDAWGMVVDAQGKWSKQKETPTYTFVCDGKTSWKQFGSMYRTDKNTAPNELSTILEPWGGFYAPDSSPYATTEYARTKEKLLEARRDGTEAVDGVVCDKVFTHYVTSYEGESVSYRTTWYIGPDGLVRRQVQHVQFGDKPGFTRDATLRNIQTGFTVESPKTLFAYTPPKGAKSQEQTAAAEPKLLANGVAAPEITAIDKGGASVKLSDMRGKVVVVDFWASWCPPCKASMPHNQEVAKKLQGEGVPMVLLAVDNSEAQPAFAEWVKAHPELSALRFVFADPKTADVSGVDYHVSGIPTQYVIDAQGIIRASFVGYGGPTDDLEKAIRAASRPVK